ncbi:formylglycine-generating enzyme family protein [Myxococcota bacterium]|nr:formylglycine-generating enzyme family protein [Myxococcota bacterium]
MKIATNSFSLMIFFILSCQDNQTISIDPEETFIEIDGVKFIKVNGGKFMMGDDNLEQSAPRTEMSVNSFYMMKTKVTVGMYKKCVVDGACEIPQNEAHHYGTCNYSTSPDDHPLDCASGKSAEKFAQWFGHNTRLPTEAEWEYVATNHGKSSNPWGEEPATCKRISQNTEINPYQTSDDCVEFGQKKPVCSYTLGYTKEGTEKFCELMGLPFEIMADGWHSFLDCRLSDQNDDIYCPNEESIPKDGSPWLNPRLPEYQLARGWYFSEDQSAANARARGVAGATRSAPDTGFRLVFTAPPAQTDD